MTTSTLNIIIGGSAIVVGLLAFSNEFGSSKLANVFKRVGVKIFIFILFGSLGVWATVKKDTKAEIESNAKELNAKTEQLRRDSSNKVYNDATNRKLFETFTNSLAKYGYKYDSTQNQIIKFIRDSTNKTVEKTSVGVCPSEEGIVSTKLPSNKVLVKIRCCNYGNHPAYDAKISYVLIVKGNHRLKTTNYQSSPSNYIFQVGTKLQLEPDTFALVNDWAHDTLYAYVQGTYTNFKRSTKQHINEFFIYNYARNEWSIPENNMIGVLSKYLKRKTLY